MNQIKTFFLLLGFVFIVFVAFCSGAAARNNWDVVLGIGILILGCYGVFCRKGVNAK